jgi:hypothetical protein
MDTMKKVTKGNLYKLWRTLDQVDGLLYNVQDNIFGINTLPKSIKDQMLKIDITAITSLKNEIEELMEQLQ